MKSKQTKQLLITARSSRNAGFWNSLEKYVGGRIAEAPIEWCGVGVGVVGIVVLISVTTGYINSPTLGSNKIEIIRTAGEQGDYRLARELYEQVEEDVLGASIELEELVYPEKKIEREIEKQQEPLLKYPGNRDLFLNLSRLYSESNNREKSAEYLEMARVLDPNGEIVESALMELE